MPPAVRASPSYPSSSSSRRAFGVDYGHLAGTAIARAMDGTHGTYGTNVNSSARVDRCSLPGMRLQKRPVPSCPPYPGWRRRKGTILVSLLTGSPIKVEDVHSDLIIPFPTGRVRFLASPGSKLPGCHHLVPSGQKAFLSTKSTPHHQIKSRTRRTNGLRAYASPESQDLKYS